MKNSKAISALFGGLADFRHVRLECEGFMPLAVEGVGPGPRGLPMVSVCHYYEQNGDLNLDYSPSASGGKVTSVGASWVVPFSGSPILPAG